MISEGSVVGLKETELYDKVTISTVNGSVEIMDYYDSLAFCGDNYHHHTFSANII